MRSAEVFFVESKWISNSTTWWLGLILGNAQFLWPWPNEFVTSKRPTLFYIYVEAIPISYLPLCQSLSRFLSQARLLKVCLSVRWLRLKPTQPNWDLSWAKSEKISITVISYQIWFKCKNSIKTRKYLKMLEIYQWKKIYQYS